MNTLLKSQYAKVLLSLLLLLTLFIISYLLIVMLNKQNFFSLISVIEALILSLIGSISSAIILFILVDKIIKKSELNNLSAIVEESMLNTHKELPTNIFHGSNLPNKIFNKKINEKFIRSENITFIGGSGKYVPVRLLKLKNNITPKKSVKLIINNSPNKNVKKRLDTHHEGEHKVFYGVNNDYSKRLGLLLFGCINCYSISNSFDIFILNYPQLNRCEVFDDSIFLEVFLETDYRKNKFPTVHSYSNESLIYKYFKDNIKNYDFTLNNFRSKEFIYEFCCIKIQFLELQKNIFAINNISIVLNDKSTQDQAFEVVNDIFNFFKMKSSIDKNLIKNFDELFKDV